MEIFRDGQDVDGFEMMKADLKVLTEAFKQIKTRTVEKSLEGCMENISDDIYMSLTVEAATEIERINEKHPDSDAIDLIDFLIWKNQVKIESAKEFVLRTDECVDENVVAQVRVYPGDYFIEIMDDGRHALNIENRGWSEPDTSLDDMELELYNFAHA